MNVKVDIAKLKKGEKIKTSDGAVLVIRGCYMSTDGVIFTANDGGGIVDRNVPLKDILEVVDAVSE